MILLNAKRLWLTICFALVAVSYDGQIIYPTVDFFNAELQPTTTNLTFLLILLAPHYDHGIGGFFVDYRLG